MNRSSDQYAYEKKLVIQPIRLKSINKERALNRSLKLSKSFTLTLTDLKFEKQINELERLRIPRIESKFDVSSLKLEIANATSRALKSVNNYSLSKENLNLRSSRRLGNRILGSNEGSPLVTERASFSGVFETNSFKNDTPKMGKNKNPEFKDFSKSFQNDGTERTGQKSKENQFIDKVREATLKLREMRQKLYGLNNIKY